MYRRMAIVITIWTDGFINSIAADDRMAAYMREVRNAWRESDDERLAQIRAKDEIIYEMRKEFTAYIAEINAALDNALMEAAALDTLNRECRQENERLRQAVNEQHAELRQRRQEVITRFM